MADPQTPEEIEANRVRLEREYAAEQARAAEERRTRDAAINQSAMTDPAKADKRKRNAKDAPADGPNSADRLRAFEDDVFGRRAVRINGQVERGIGSPYAALTDERKAQYAALEDLVAAEQQLNDATAAVGVAEAARVAAEERLAMCDKLAQEKAAAVDAEKAEDDKAAQEKAAKDKALAAG